MGYAFASPNFCLNSTNAKNPLSYNWYVFGATEFWISNSIECLRLMSRLANFPWKSVGGWNQRSQLVHLKTWYCISHCWHFSMWMALNWTLCFIVIRTNGRIIFIIQVSLEDLLLTILTKALLSIWNKIFLFSREVTYRNIARTTGTISRNDIFFIKCEFLQGHLNCAHKPLKYTPQPNSGFPLLSVNNFKVSFEIQSFSGKKHWPLKLSKNCNHRLISAFTFKLSLILW